MLRNPNFQKLINIGVIVVLLAIPLAGAMLFLPQRSPVGPLLGQLTKLSPTKYYLQNIISGLMSSMDPEAVAQALDENPDLLVEMVGYMDIGGLAGAINDNADWVAELLGYVDASVIARAVNENPEFLEELMGGMDAKAVVDIVNMNTAAWAVDLVNAIDPKVLAEVINQNGDFLSYAMGSMDPAPIAKIGADLLSKLQLQPFANSMLGYLDPQVIANAVNNNGPWVISLIGSVDPSAMNSAMTPDVATFAGQVIGLVDPGVVAEIANSVLSNNNPFISGIIRSLDINSLSRLLAEVMPSAGGFVKKTLANLNPSFIGAVVDDTAFLTRMMGKINPSVLGVHMGTIMDFASNVIAYVDPTAITAIMNNAGSFINGMLNAMSPDFFAAIMGDAGLLNNVMAAINFDPIANAINNNGAVITGLLVKVGAVDAGTLTGVVGDVVKGVLTEENVGFIEALVGELDIDKLMGMVAGMKPWISQLLGELDPGVIANVINNNGPWVASVLPQVDPNMITPILDEMDTSFISGLMQKLDIATLSGIVNDMGPFITEIMPKLDMAALAGAINDNIPVVGDIINYLDPTKLAAMVNNMGSLVGELIQYLDGEVIATALNKNTAFMEKVLLSIDLDVILAAVNTDIGEAFLTRVMGSMTSMQLDMGPILAVIGDATDFITGFMDPVDGIDLNIIVPILDEAGPLVSDLVQYMDFGTLTSAVANALVPSYQTGGPDGLLYDVIKPPAQGGIDPAMLADVFNNLNLGPLVGEVLGNLDMSAFMPLLERDSVKNFIGEVVGTLQTRPGGVLNILNGVNTPASCGNLHTIVSSLTGDIPLLSYLMDQLSLPHQTLDSTLDWLTAQIYIYGLSGLLSDPYAYGMIGTMGIASP